MRSPIIYTPGNSAIQEAVRAVLYESILDILGAGGTVVPLGDAKHGVLTGTTLATVGDEQVTYTLSGAASFQGVDTRPGLKGVVPSVEFNGSDESVNTPDDAAWDGGDGSNDSAISVGCWVNFPSATESGYLFSKFLPISSGDWALDLTSGKPRFSVRDASVFKNPSLTANVAVSANAWRHLVITYDGTGGTNALTDPNCQIYVDGSKVASTFGDDGGGYVAMEGSTNNLEIAADEGSGFYAGKMAGGPLGPFFVKSELSADAVLRLYETGRRALNV